MGNLLHLEHRADGGGFSRAFRVPADTNRVQALTIGDGAYAYGFDANGNLVAEASVRLFSWNHADQLAAFRVQTPGAEPSVCALYAYDATGRRVKKLVRRQGGQCEVTHSIDGAFEHQRWPGGENNVIHVMDNQQRVALVRVGPPRPGDSTPAEQVQLPDHLGSSNVVVDATGAAINREEFTPYGETSFGSFLRKRYRYTGMERDEESGLTYHGARYASAALARWLSCDPAIAVPIASAYEFANSSPVRYVDRTGQSSSDSDPPPQPAAPPPDPPAPARPPSRTWNAIKKVLRAAGVAISLKVGNPGGVLTPGPIPPPAKPLERNEETEERDRKLQKEVDARDAMKRKARVGPPNPESEAASPPRGEAGHVPDRQMGGARGSDPDAGAGGSGQAGVTRLGVIATVAGLALMGLIFMNDPSWETAKKLTEGALAQEAFVGGARALLGKAARGASGLFFFFSNMRSDSATHSREEEQRELQAAGEAELKRLVSVYADTHPGASRAAIRDMIISDVLAAQQRAADFWARYGSILRDPMSVLGRPTQPQVH